MAKKTHENYQRQIADLQQQVQQLKMTSNNSQPPPAQWYPSAPMPYQPQAPMGGRGGRGNKGCDGGRGGRGHENQQHKDVSCYCWSHGVGRHWSWQCNNPLPGHNYHATFQNKMGDQHTIVPTPKWKIRPNNKLISFLHPPVSLLK